MATERSAKAVEKTERILTAAGSVLSQYGFAQTTIARVAEAAGVSRGLVHYHFKNKEEMLAKVLRSNMEKSVDAAKAILSQCETPESFVNELISAFKTLVENDPNYFNLFLEGLVTARHSEVVCGELSVLYEEFRTSLKKGLQHMEKARGASFPISAEGLATLITGILDGIGMQFIMIPGMFKEEKNWDYLKKGLFLMMTAGITGGRELKSDP